MILNYKYPAICAIGVGTTDDALGKYCLVAVSEEGEQFPCHVESNLASHYITLHHCDSKGNLTDYVDKKKQNRNLLVFSLAAISLCFFFFCISATEDGSTNDVFL